MRCPECGHAGSEVVDTRRSEKSRVSGTEAVRRRRECTGCGHRYSTVEVLADDWPGEEEFAVFAPEVLGAVDQIMSLLDARLEASETTAHHAARVLIRRNPEVTPVDLRRALGLSDTYARQLHQLHSEAAE